MELSLTDLFDERLLFFNLEAPSREEFLGMIALELKQLDYVKDSYKDAIIERELKYPTGATYQSNESSNPPYGSRTCEKTCY